MIPYMQGGAGGASRGQHPTLTLLAGWLQCCRRRRRRVLGAAGQPPERLQGRMGYKVPSNLRASEQAATGRMLVGKQAAPGDPPLRRRAPAAGTAPLIQAGANRSERSLGPPAGPPEAGPQSAVDWPLQPQESFPTCVPGWEEG